MRPLFDTLVAADPFRLVLDRAREEVVKIARQCSPEARQVAQQVTAFAGSPESWRIYCGVTWRTWWRQDPKSALTYLVTTRDRGAALAVIEAARESAVLLGVCADELRAFDAFIASWAGCPDELWPVLRAHAEWLVGRVLEMTAGAAGLEVDVPARLQAEPAVFGGATGAEVYVEIVRRIVSPDEALARLGGARARLVDGPNPALLGECALAPEEGTLVTRAKAATLGEVLGAGSKPDLPAVLYALVQLGVLEALAPAASPGPRKAEGPRAYDALDEQALRSRILARKALVEEGDYFALLGVGKSATSYDVQRAYTELRREFEPSRILTASTANLRDEVDLILEVLDEAYEILSDQLRRERYRRALEATPS